MLSRWKLGRKHGFVTFSGPDLRKTKSEESGWDVHVGRALSRTFRRANKPICFWLMVWTPMLLSLHAWLRMHHKLAPAKRTSPSPLRCLVPCCIALTWRLQFLKAKGKVVLNTVVAIRPGRVVGADDINFESDEDEDGTSLEVRFPNSQHVRWLKYVCISGSTRGTRRLLVGLGYEGPYLPSSWLRRWRSAIGG